MSDAEEAKKEEPKVQDATDYKTLAEGIEKVKPTKTVEQIINEAKEKGLIKETDAVKLQEDIEKSNAEKYVAKADIDKLVDEKIAKIPKPEVLDKEAFKKELLEANKPVPPEPKPDYAIPKNELLGVAADLLSGKPIDKKYIKKEEGAK